MARNPARPDHVGHVIRTDEEIRQLRIRPNLDKNPNVIDLAPYLYVFNATPGASFHGWEDYSGAGFHVSDGRCFLTGLIKWEGGTSNYGSRGTNGNLSILSTALPAYARPPADVTVELAFDIISTTWNPAPLGGTDGYYGASIQVIATSAGQLEQPTIFGNAYSGRARKASDSTTYSEGCPEGSVLILEGHSWAVASSD